MDSSDDSKGFLKHVFNFDDDSKYDILNIIQYAIIALIPVIILNKSMSNYVPEADDKKSSVELSAEIIIQIIVMFIGLLLIHRVVTFVPTYSGVKLGEKVSILFDRLMDLWNGTDSSKKKGKSGNVKVTQPIAGQQQQQMGGSITGQVMPQSQPTYTDGTAINSLPTSSSTQQLPNYDNMYKQQNTPLVNAATPGGMEGFQEPMAANEAFGGFGGWSSW